MVDSGPAWHAVEVELARAHGGTWHESDSQACIGHPLEVTARRLRDRSTIRGTDTEIIRELSARLAQRFMRGGVPFRPGVPDLIEQARLAGLTQVLVTSASGSYVDALQRHLPAFTGAITGREVGVPKPDPEAYRRALDLIGETPDSVLALEDSAVGIAAATSAGLCTLACAGRAHGYAVAGVVTDLSSLRVEDLRDLHRRWLVRR